MIKIIFITILVILAIVIALFGNDAQMGGTGWKDFKEWLRSKKWKQ
jgi:hypothetical protein